MVACLTMSAGNLLAMQGEPGAAPAKPDLSGITIPNASIPELKNAVTNITKDMNSVFWLDNGNVSSVVFAEKVKPVTMVARTVEEQSTPQMVVLGYPLYHRIEKTTVEKTYQGSLNFTRVSRGEGNSISLGIDYGFNIPLRPTTETRVRRRPTKLGYSIGVPAIMLTVGAVAVLAKSYFQK